MKYYQPILATISILCAMYITATTSPDDPMFFMSGAIAVITAGSVVIGRKS
jgi:hypothetical protein